MLNGVASKQDVAANDIRDQVYSEFVSLVREHYVEQAPSCRIPRPKIQVWCCAPSPSVARSCFVPPQCVLRPATGAGSSFLQVHVQMLADICRHTRSERCCFLLLQPHLGPKPKKSAPKAGTADKADQEALSAQRHNLMTADYNKRRFDWNAIKAEAGKPAAAPPPSRKRKASAAGRPVSLQTVWPSFTAGMVTTTVCTETILLLISRLYAAYDHTLCRYPPVKGRRQLHLSHKSCDVTALISPLRACITSA